MREKSSLEIEIFGCDEPIAPSTPVPRSAPWDDPLFSLTPGTGTADALCNQLVDDAFIADASGLKPEQVRKTVTSPIAEPVFGSIFAKVDDAKRREDLERRFIALVESTVNRELVPLRAEVRIESRKAALASRAPMRKRDIEKMLRPLRAMFRNVAPHAETFSQLTASIEGFVVGAIIAEA